MCWEILNNLSNEGEVLLSALPSVFYRDGNKFPKDPTIADVMFTFFRGSKMNPSTYRIWSKTFLLLVVQVYKSDKRK